MDPWDLIGPISLIFLVVGAVLGFSKSDAVPSIIGYTNILVLYIPVSLVLAGFIPDIISQSLNFSVVSFTGIIGVILNRLLSSLVMSRITGVQPANLAAGLTKLGTDVDKLQGINIDIAKYQGAFSGCTVPGFELFESTLVPQSLVLLCSMYAFLMLDILVNDSSKSVGGLSIGFGMLLLAQTMFSVNNGCFDPGFFVYGENKWISGLGIIVSLILISMTAAGIGYGIKKTLPKSSSSSGSKSLLGGVVAPSSSGLIATKDVGISEQDQFVCDAYKNGELVTSTIVE
jgi:hypothetical protein